MNCKIFFFVLWTFSFVNISSFTINPKPICTVYTPNSTLQQKANYKPILLGKRMRYSTCTGAAWFHENHLAVLNRNGEELITYIFDEEKKEFTFLQKMSKQDGKLDHPEQMAISSDGTLLAIGNTRRSCINIYAIDLKNHLINPNPIVVLPTHNFIHGIRFSYDNKYLAFASFDDNASLWIYKVLNDSSNVKLKLVYKKASDSKLLKVKGVNFSQDNRYIVLTYTLDVHSANKVLRQNKSLKSLLVAHTFNQDGTVGKVISSVQVNAMPEDIGFINNNSAIVASDQYYDRLLIYPFNPKTGKIESNYTVIQNPEAKLSFPHGISISSNGKCLAVTNYGNDSVNLYQVD